ncbi:hypothetical protein ElyMa_005968500 [Elysia marginata]|uniref:Uncharacterized protein n=1 Tax=Elysia marginata TaxID=1093978 RepID=A0AAV4GFG1_9GAST|nr:hypothetical protein ElyMa_005968500 [Elysia marginata]
MFMNWKQDKDDKNGVDDDDVDEDDGDNEHDDDDGNHGGDDNDGVDGDGDIYEYDEKLKREIRTVQQSKKAHAERHPLLSLSSHFFHLSHGTHARTCYRLASTRYHKTRKQVLLPLAAPQISTP